RTDTSTYKNPDNDERGVWIPIPIYANHKYDADYQIIKPNGIILNRPKNNYWRLSEDTMKKHIEENRLWWGEGESYPMIKRFLTEVQDGLVPKSIFYYDEVGGNPHGDSEVKLLFDTEKLFENPKSVKLIKHFLQIGTSSSDIILDFFAGSGTTGDAVMQLNAEDGGDRKFILVQIDEKIDEKKNKTAFDFVKNELETEPTIFEITKERLIRASAKINKELDTKINNIALKIKILNAEIQTEPTKTAIITQKEAIKKIEKQKTKNYFKVFETMPIWEDYDFEADKLVENQKLFDQSKLTEDDKKALLITWKTYDGIALTQSLASVDLGGYISYYGNNKLYFIDKGFTTNNLVNLLGKIDEDKNFNPTSIIAFGYHFDSKNLLELSESVKSYRNRKNIDIDFITRY
ncbi:MAG: site-specific DNA-methyltransferase, partial [Cytophagales bacterium]